MTRLNRRQLLQFTGSLAVTGMVKQVVASPWLEVIVYTPEGIHLAKELLQQLYFLDLQDNPLPTPGFRVESGRVYFEPPAAVWAIALLLPVPGFGEVTLYADNQGRGYTPRDFPLNLNLAFAVSRLYRVQEFVNTATQRGIQFPDSLEKQLSRAKTYLNYAHNHRGIPGQSHWLYRSLATSLWAGERAVLLEAQQSLKNRDSFLFGANFFGYPRLGEVYNERFRAVFNFATVPLYWHNWEPEQGQLNFTPVDDMVNWLRRAQITPKGHPLVWFHEIGTPVWLRDQSYPQVKQLVADRVLRITSHYGAKIPYYDIINEANGIPWANYLGYSQEQFLELTKIAAEVSRQGYPDVYRIINHCCLWAENVAYGTPPQTSPYQYLRACLEAEIPFEAIGLQLYYPQQDMFEINRLLERFSRLGKPIHITEIGVASDYSIDKGAYLQEPKGMWHEPWNQRVQANWLEQLYTICYSKPYIKAISWWDLADVGNFWPHGGLLHGNLEPKLAYWRLSRLLRSF